MANIKFTGVHKSFGSNKIITDFNLLGKEDEFLVLVGPSGCGKSTLLRMIAGLEKIDEGEIFINDQKINELHPSKRQTAMVFQSYALYPHMNVYENMSFGLKIEKRPKEEINTKVMQAAKILKIEELLERKPKQLSGGQLRAEMRVEISKLHNQIKTNMIYVTHDQVEAMTLADRIVILNQGNIEQVGTPEEIYNDPANIFVAQFIGTPKMNILEVNEENIVSENTIKLLGNDIQFNDLKIKKSKHFVGIRPEHLKANQNTKFTFNPEIELIENLGNEKIVYMKKDEHQLSAKIPSNIEIGSSIGFDLNDIFIFDENGKRLKS